MKDKIIKLEDRLKMSPDKVITLLNEGYTLEKDTLEIKNLAPTCSTASKLVGQGVTVGATPSSGTPPYTVAFQIGGVPFKTFPGVPEATNVSYVYTLVAGDVGSKVFSAVITDSCATGAKIITESCTVSVALSCDVPVANFTLS